jgi:hypothetical protein
MKRLVLAFALAFASAASFAQTPSESADAFLKQVATPKSDAALDSLFVGSGMAELKPQAITTLKGQIKMAMALYGTPLGLEKVQEEDISPSVKRLVYIQKFENLPVAWEFYFYKPKDTWIINTLTFKDQIASIVGSR